MKLDTKDFVLDLYEMELNKKSMYSNDVMSNTAKEGKESEFAVAVKNIKIIEELLDLLGNEFSINNFCHFFILLCLNNNLFKIIL